MLRRARRRRRAAHARRAAPRGDARADVSGRGGRRGRGRDLGGDRRPDGARRAAPGATATGRDARGRPRGRRLGHAARGSCWGSSAVLPGAAFVLASTVLRAAADGQGRRRDRAAARGGPRRGPRRRRDRGRPARRADRGGRRPRGPRAARRRGPRGRRVRDRRPPGPTPRRPTTRPGERVIRAGEPIVLDIGGTVGGYGSDITRTLWVTGGDPANGPDDEFRHLFAVLQQRPGGRRRPRSGRASPARRSTASRAPDHTAAGYGEASSTGPATASASRATRSRTSSPATASRWPQGMAFSVEPGIYLGDATARGSRTSSSAARRARRRSTRRRASCTSSTAEARRRPGGRSPGRRGVSSADPVAPAPASESL